MLKLKNYVTFYLKIIIVTMKFIAQIKGQMIIRTLFNALTNDFKLIPKQYYEGRENNDKDRVVCDISLV